MGVYFEANARQNARYHALRLLGYAGAWAAKHSTVPRFCEAVRAKGRDPSEYGELSWARRGGPVRIIGPTPNMLRGHVLRELGGCAEEVKNGSRSRASFEAMTRRLLARRRTAA